MRIECLCGTNPHRFLPLDAFLKPKNACAVKPEVLKSWTLEMDYSRAPCLGADQMTCGLWERDWGQVAARDQNFNAKYDCALGNWSPKQIPVTSPLVCA